MPPSQAPPRRPAARWRVLLIAAIVLVVGYAADQFTKYLVVTHMQLGEKIWVIEPVLKWYSIRNSGAAFSMGEGYTWIFTIFMGVVALGVLLYLPRVRSLLWALALGGLLAGTLGNLTDRLFQPPSFGMGHVVDFVSVGNFAIFNIADSLIVCSVIGIVLLLWTGVPTTGGPRQSAAEAGAKAEATGAVDAADADAADTAATADPKDAQASATDAAPSQAASPSAEAERTASAETITTQDQSKPGTQA